MIWNLFGPRPLPCASLTDMGLVRTDNQDALFVDARTGVFVVADGMGGGSGGAIASACVCEELARVTAAPAFADRLSYADTAVIRANARIRNYARAQGFAQMGTTVAALFVDRTPKSARLAFAWLGDSRVYRRRGHVFELLTRDHRKSAYSHVLTRAVGVSDEIALDWGWADVASGDLWLVCSDGVHDMLPDSTLNGLLAQGGTPEEMVRRIAASVRTAGARDNFTLCIVRTP